MISKYWYSDSAKNDLLEAWLFIAKDSIHAADEVLDRIDREVNTLSKQPYMGRSRPELGFNIRSWPTSTSYILFYQPELDGITIVRVLHHATKITQLQDPSVELISVK